MPCSAEFVFTSRSCALLFKDKIWLSDGLVLSRSHALAWECPDLTQNGGHMFARLPVGPAIRWLEAHTSRDPATLLDFAATRVGQGGYRDAVAALKHTRTLSLDDNQNRRADELARQIDAKAEDGAAKYLPLIRQAKDGSWIDGWLAFRDDFEFADAAHEATDAFAELRARHDKPAKDAFAAARQLFQQGKQDEGYKKYSEIVQSYYASPLYRTVKRWLAERKIS